MMTAGVKIEFYLGQKVRLKNDEGRVGTLQGLSLDDHGINATVVLDEPIIIPPHNGFREHHIHNQNVHILEIEAV